MAKLAFTVWAIVASLAIYTQIAIAQCTLYTPNAGIGITNSVQFQTSWVGCTAPVVIQFWDADENSILTSYTGDSAIVDFTINNGVGATVYFVLIDAAGLKATSIRYVVKPDTATTSTSSVVPISTSSPVQSSSIPPNTIVTTTVSSPAPSPTSSSTSSSTGSSTSSPAPISTIQTTSQQPPTTPANPQPTTLTSSPSPLPGSSSNSVPPPNTPHTTTTLYTSVYTSGSSTLSTVIVATITRSSTSSTSTTSSSTPSPSSSHKSTNTAAIAGGAAGGAVALVVLASLLYFCLRDRRQRELEDYIDNPPHQIPSSPMLPVLGATGPYGRPNTEAQPSGYNTTQTGGESYPYPGSGGFGPGPVSEIQPSGYNTTQTGGRSYNPYPASAGVSLSTPGDAPGYGGPLVFPPPPQQPPPSDTGAAVGTGFRNPETGGTFGGPGLGPGRAFEAPSLDSQPASGTSPSGGTGPRLSPGPSVPYNPEERWSGGETNHEGPIQAGFSVPMSVTRPGRDGQDTGGQGAQGAYSGFPEV